MDGQHHHIRQNKHANTHVLEGYLLQMSCRQIREPC